MKRLFFIIVSLLCLSNPLFAGFDGFDFEDNPAQPVTHAGALLVKQYPQNHPDGRGKQLCFLMGHDQNLTCTVPPGGSIDAAKDIEMKDGRIYYSSLLTIIREVLEETGAYVKLGNKHLQRDFLVYSPTFHDLFTVVRDDTFSCQALTNAVIQAIADPDKDGSWKEMSHYDAFPVNNVFSVAQIMRTHFEEGGNIHNLPESILSPRKSCNGNPLVYVTTRSGKVVDFCAYYMGAIGDILPQLKAIVMPNASAIDKTLYPTGYAAKIENLPDTFIVTTDFNANASYQLKSHRFAVATGQTVSVPYNITVAEGSKVSLGLLNTRGNGWYGNELVWGPGSYQGIFERIVPENETTAEIVFRNYHLDKPGQSVFTVYHTAIKVEDKYVEVQLMSTTNPIHVSRKKRSVKVTTDHNANASYQLESKRFSVKAGERIRIPYDITVEDGGIMSLGLLNSLRTMWYPSQVGGETEELILKTGRHKGIFERIIPEGEAEASVVFRNYHLGTPGQTTFTITDLKIERGI